MKAVIILLCLAAAANARPRSLRQQCPPTDPDCQQILPRRQSGPPEDEYYKNFIDGIVDDILRHLESNGGRRQNGSTTRELAEQLVKWVVGKAFEFFGFGRLRQSNGQKDHPSDPQCDIMSPDWPCNPEITPRRQLEPPDDEEYRDFIDSVVDDVMPNLANSGLLNGPIPREVVKMLVISTIEKAFDYFGSVKRRQKNGQKDPHIVLPCDLLDPNCPQTVPRRQSGPPEDEEYRNFINSLVDDIMSNLGNGAGGLRDAPTTRELAEQLVKWVVGKAFDFFGFLRRRQSNGQKDPPICNGSMDPDCQQIAPRRQSGPPDEAAVNNFINSVADEIMHHMQTSAGGLRNAPPTKDLVEQLVSWFVGKAIDFIGIGRLRQSNGPICNLLDQKCWTIKKRRQSGLPDEAAINDFINSLVDNIMHHMENGAGGLRDTPPAKEIVLQLVGWLYDQTSKFLGLGLRQA